MLIKAIVNWILTGVLGVGRGSRRTRNSSSSAKQGKKKRLTKILTIPRKDKGNILTSKSPDLNPMGKQIKAITNNRKDVTNQLSRVGTVSRAETDLW
jgi:hypothetical protein